MYYALNAQTVINPMVGNEYAAKETHILLVLKKRSFNGVLSNTAIVLSGDGHGNTEKVGQVINLTADQSRRFMGQYQVVGLVEGERVEGEVPNRKFKHYVMK